MPNALLQLPARQVSLEPGAVVLRRAVMADAVVHVDSGRLALGLVEDDGLTHLLGTAVGPLWLEASAAILGRPSLIDAVAETPVVLRRLPLADFTAGLNTGSIDLKAIAKAKEGKAVLILLDLMLPLMPGLEVLRHLRERSLISGSGRVVNLVDPGGLRSLAGV